jgi:membrane protease YdiL (CAAX protease family)
LNIYKQNNVEIDWTINLPIAIIVLYLASNLLLVYLSWFTELNFIFPQSYFLLAIFYLIFIKKIKLRNLGLSKENLKNNLFLGFFLILLFSMCITISEFILSYYLKSNQKYAFKFDPLIFFLMIIIAPINEEIIFRGILFSSLKKEFR